MPDWFDAAVRRSRSIRVRITAAAIVVVAATISLAGWALVNAVETQLVDDVRTTAGAKIDAVADQLASGISPSKVILPAPTSGVGFVQVLSADGQQIAGAPIPFAPGDILFVRGDVAAGEKGGSVIDAPLGGVGNGATTVEVPLDIRYQGVATPNGTVTVVATSPLDGVTQSIDALKRFLLIGSPLLVALVGAIAWFVTGRALRPVDAMRADVDAITASTIDRRVPEPATGDEISRLAHTMNSMLDRLEASAVRQRQFVSDASHELRSPVAAMRAELEVGLREGDRADWPQIATDVLMEEARLEALIADLLLLAAVDERGMGPDGPKDVDLAKVVRADAARARLVPVTVDGLDCAVVSGARDQLARVSSNLLDNAARFADTAVHVTVARADSSIVVHVDDDGPGIPERDRERVFERFTRLDGSRARTVGGAGLGLALARAIVERHHGSITVATSPAGGARLTIRFPEAPTPD